MSEITQTTRTFFEQWFNDVTTLRQQMWVDFRQKTDPLNVGELATVSLLASAAVRLGYSAITEVVEADNADHSRGRQDLVIAGRDLEQPLAFEFKVGWPTNGREAYLKPLLEDACCDARGRLQISCRRFGGVVYVPYAEAGTPSQEDFRQTLIKCRQLHSETDFQYDLGGADRPALIVLRPVVL